MKLLSCEVVIVSPWMQLLKLYLLDTEQMYGDIVPDTEYFVTNIFPWFTRPMMFVFYIAIITHGAECVLINQRDMKTYICRDIAPDSIP